MQFTVTLELNDQELKALSKGNFEEIRKDFFQNADFCNFVINTYEINNEFLDLALAQHKISTFSFGKSLKSSICWTTRSNCQNPSSNSVCSTGVCMMSIKPLQKVLARLL